MGSTEKLGYHRPLILVSVRGLGYIGSKIFTFSGKLSVIARKQSLGVVCRIYSLFWAFEMECWNETVTAVCPLWAFTDFTLPVAPRSGRRWGSISAEHVSHSPDFNLQKESEVLKGSPRILTLLTLPLAKYSG